MGALTRRRTILGLALLVAAGSTVGTLARASIELTFPTPPGSWPWATFAINLAGSFLLGALLESLARSGEDSGWRRKVRLGVGTGIIGGFTTYSTFIVEIDQTVQASHGILAAAYALVSIVLGVVCAGLGVAAAHAAWPAPVTVEEANG